SGVYMSTHRFLAAKQRLFTRLLDGSGFAVINADDPRAAELSSATRGSVITYGLRESADVAAVDVASGFRGLRFTLCIPGGRYALSTRLLGIPNVYNLLAGIAAIIPFGISPGTIVRAVEEMPPVEGRFESIESADGVLFVIDYAHTPDALKSLLDTVSAIPHGRIITVFGCGGDRDQGKRPLMGGIASAMSDFSVITSDNPRFENPDAIIEDIVRGIQGRSFTIIADRREAIRDAVGRARKGDIVVIAGKGHETYQEVRGERFHLDDRELVREAISRSGVH
ncbi:MAG: Mur ligase family protein, partial [Thermodesulfovibrionales bacterium]